MPPNATARPRALIVDDDTAVRRALRRELEATFDVLEAASAADAIASLAANSEVCAVVSDLVLGADADGHALLRHVSAHVPAAARIMVSGTATARTVNPAVVDTLVPKPWGRGGVLSAVQAALHARSTKAAAPPVAPPAPHAAGLRSVDPAAFIALLGAAGYGVSFRDGAFSECLVRCTGETWVGYGATREAALLDVVERMHPSIVSRRLLQARLMAASIEGA